MCRVLVLNPKHIFLELPLIKNVWGMGANSGDLNTEMLISQGVNHIFNRN